MMRPPARERMLFGAAQGGAEQRPRKIFFLSPNAAQERKNSVRPATPEEPTPHRTAEHSYAPPYSTLIPASLITLLHFAISPCRNAPNSSDVPGLGSAPAFRSPFAVAGSLSPRTRSALTRLTMAAAVPAGATSPRTEQ